MNDDRELPSTALIVGIVLVVSMLLSLFGCAWAYPPGNPKVPLPAPVVPVAVLLAEPVAVEAKEAPFDLRFYPALVLAGSGSWMTCHVPPSWKAERIDTWFEGKREEPRPMPRYLYQPEFINAIPCGRWRAFCDAVLPDGQIRRVERSILSRGDCNEDGQERPHPGPA